MKLTSAILALCLAIPAIAQDSTKFYRLDFTVRELDDNKVISTKNYSTFSSADGTSKGASIRTGNKVPYQSAPNSYQFAEVGVGIDIPRCQEAGGQLIVTVAAEVSTIPTGTDAPNQNNMVLPHIRTNRWNSTVMIPIGKATLLFSSDDLNSKRKLQLEVLATPVK